jgi:hypothetical protein
VGHAHQADELLEVLGEELRPVVELQELCQRLEREFEQGDQGDVGGGKSERCPAELVAV